MGCAKAGATAGSFADGFDHGWEGVAEDHRTPGAKEIDVAISVSVVEGCAFSADDEGRVAAYRPEGADRGVDSAGEVLLGAALEVERVHEGLEFMGFRWHGHPPLYIQAIR